MKNPFKNKLIVNFHHADFDGAISGCCTKAAFGENVINKAFSIMKVSDAVLEIIDDVDLLLLTDISIQHNYIEQLSDYLKQNKLIIYDHHLNDLTEKIFSNYSKDSFSILNPNMCGATITWLQLLKFYNNNKLKDLEQIVYLSDVYDMWRIDNNDFEYASKINDLLDYNIGYTPDQFRNRFFNNPDPYTLTANEKIIIDRKKIKHHENLKLMKNNATLFDYKDHVFVLTESQATDYTKMHFMNEVLECEAVDMFIFKYPGGTQCSVRIPAKSKIDDLNDWYEYFGCAGHKKAGGIQKSEYNRLKSILNSI